MHSDKFWSENASKFEHKDFLAIRLLVDLLASTDTQTVVLVRCTLPHSICMMRRTWLLTPAALDKIVLRFLVLVLTVGHECVHDVGICIVHQACRDLGEFARFYDGGKKIIQHYKGKVKIMQLMASEDRDIQKAALLSSAKLLINNWEHV